MNPQRLAEISLDVFAHFEGTPKIVAPENVKAKPRPAPGEHEYEPPDALARMDPGELVEVRPSSAGDGDALVLVSHGRMADLTGKRKLIESAHAANRPIEIHVFDEPPPKP